jgi:hypothetical protein
MIVLAQRREDLFGQLSYLWGAIRLVLGAFVFISSIAVASGGDGDKDCDRSLRDTSNLSLRDTSYRHLPKDGSSKDGIVDYKLINQLLMSLRRAVLNKYPLPKGFEAQLTPKKWADAPVGGVLLTGVLSSPHRLAGKKVTIEIQREGLAIVATVTCGELGLQFERDISHLEYLSVFPYTATNPMGHGGLLSLVRGVQENAEMQGWSDYLLR